MFIYSADLLQNEAELVTIAPSLGKEAELQMRSRRSGCPLISLGLLCTDLVSVTFVWFLFSTLLIQSTSFWTFLFISFATPELAVISSVLECAIKRL